jgi:hypothetical protein
MIRYSLTCDKNHAFDSWFQSAEAYDRLLASGQVTCGFCGSAKVTKSLMAPSVTPARQKASPPGALTTPQSPVEAALAAMRRQIEENSDYVGLNFAAEARAIHEGDSPQRSIYGEARADDARRLIEDGVPVAPLPFLPARKVN